jgi:predicted DNA-binding transcriptional regulator AlpA
MADVVIPIRARSIRAFCREYGFSKSHYYNLRRRGLAPRTLRVGAKQIVTNEAADEWVERMKALELDGGAK